MLLRGSPLEEDGSETLAGGETGALIRARDWSGTPLGPVADWSSSLRVSVQLMLDSPLPTVLAWGSELTFLHNDAYRPILGDRPNALGRPLFEVWAEVADALAPMLRRALDGEVSTQRDAGFVLDRQSGPEEAWFDYSFSPVRNEAGGVVGVLHQCVEITARVLADRARTEGERRLKEAVNATALSSDFRALFEAAPTPLMALAPPDWTVVALNDARLEVTGTTRAEQIGRKLFDLYPDDPDDPDADGVRNLSASLERVLATGVTDAMPVQRYAVRDADGRFVERWWSSVNTPVLDSRGAIALVIHRAEEVTELVRLRGQAAASDQLARDQQAVIDRERAAAAALRHSEAENRRLIEGLRASEEFNRRVLAASADCIKVLDLDGRVEFMNEGGMSAMEVDDFGALRGTCWPDLWTGDEHGRAVEAMAKAKRDGTGRFQGFATTMKGTPRWWDVIVTAIGGADGAPEKLLSISRDVTATQEAEARLRELNDTLEARVAERTAERDRMWETSPDLMVVIDFDGVFRRLNPAWSTVLGYAPDELVGRHVNEFVMDDDHASTIAAYELAAEGGQPRIENRYRHKDGSVRQISWTAAPAGDLTYATGRDVTAERLAAEELEQARDQLRQSQKVEALGQLTGGIAHDFNNLLTVIRSSADLLRRRELSDDKRRRYIDAISDTADRAAALTRQLLAFARRQALKAEVFDAGERIQGIADMLRTLLGSRIDLSLEVGGDHVHVDADPGQFETAVVNMAVNARDAMGGEGRLTIMIRGASATPATRGHHGAPGDFAAISMMDTGSGIAPEHIDRIFEPFFTTKDVGQGTGLGLSQLFGFAKQSGGEVDVRSVPGQGSTFTLYLPRAKPPEATVTTIVARQVAEGRGRVLVVEDNAAVGEFATTLLADLGYETALAANADDALRLLGDGGSFDLVFSDVVMPGMGGVELGVHIQERWPRLPLVLTSGYSHVLAADARHGFPLLHKPYSVEELSRVLRAALTHAALE